jgi:Flp pilus assembly protein TadG
MRRLKSECGQALVEFAVVVPILLVLIFGIVQVAVTYNHYLTITDAARVGARDAAVGRLSSATPADVQQAVLDASKDLDPNQLTVGVDDPTWNVSGSDVTVTVTYPYSINILGVVVASGTLQSSITERVE